MDKEECCFCKTSARNEGPEFLPCLHTICSPCLKVQLQKKDEKGSKCPVCNYPFEREQLIPNFLLENTLKSPLVCDCERSVKLFQCSECSKTFCPLCKEDHQTHPTTKQHTITQIVSTEMKYQLMRMNKCSECARKEIKVFCTVCLEYVCCDCQLLGSHKRHALKLTPLEDKLKSIKKELEDKIEYFGTVVGQLRGKREKAIQEAERIDLLKDESLGDLEGQFEQLKTGLEMTSVQLQLLFKQQNDQ